jgi:hypothetical protein
MSGNPLTKPSPASLRAQRMLTDLFSEENDYRVGVVVLSYRLPGAGEREVSFAHASGMRAADGTLDFVLLAKTLRQIADNLDRVTSDPAEIAQQAKGVRLR